ncbi:hypothetical protein ABSA28_00889 [Candidatus Hepatincolaceae symbiont of Richtersius coronifer]
MSGLKIKFIKLLKGIKIFLRKNIYLKGFIITVFMIFLYNCGGSAIYNPNKYNSNSLYFLKDPPLDPYFTLCGELFAKRSDVNYEAGLKCANLGKKQDFIKRRFFTSCYLAAPVVYIYSCV